MAAMFEFDSVSVSSFDASSLASTLTERSADGWDVVAIVPAGSDVVAYLRKTLRGAEAAAAIEQADSSGATETETDEAADPARSSGSALFGAEASPATDTESGGDTGAPVSTTDSGGNGWAAANDTGANGSAPATSSNWSDTSTSASGGTDSTGPTPTSSSWIGSSQQAAAAPATPTPQVPAGWYADPAGRFELRYWDGGAWTEHVSRNGQQFTDPPVR